MWPSSVNGIGKEVSVDPLSVDDNWLYGYQVSGVGGIAADVEVCMGPLAKVNFLVGRNNHGKSTVLRAAMQWTTARSTHTATGIRVCCRDG